MKKSILCFLLFKLYQRKDISLIIFLNVIYSLGGLSQNISANSSPCGNDQLLENALKNPESKSVFDKTRIKMRERIRLNAIKKKDIAQPNSYVIPVVVHIVGDGLAQTISDTDIQDQIDHLNEGFANNLGSPHAVSDDAQITFCLAGDTPTNGPWNTQSGFPGVTRTDPSDINAINVSNNHNMHATANNGQQDLSNIQYFPPDEYLNIWVVNSISEIGTTSNTVLGYAPFPLAIGAPNQLIDGIIMRSDAFGIGSQQAQYNQGGTLIHEAGHYLGLFHTFQFGCAELSSGGNCSSNGDECCDTPPIANPNQINCPDGVPSFNNCISGLDGMIENHMDYSFDNASTCRNTFTEDQADRMHATIQLYRSNLVSFPNLLATNVACLPTALNPTFITDQPNQGTQFCAGQSYGFISVPGAVSYNWDFPGAVPSTSTDPNPTGISWSIPGSYTVSLTVSDGTNLLSSNLTVFVTTCNPIVGPNSNWHFGMNCDIDFSSGIPTSPNNSVMQTLEASASISDNLGNLVFYTNGQNIWDENHMLCPNQMNGDPNNTSFTSSTRQGVVSFQKPGSSNYYIFTNSDRPVLPVIGEGFGLSMYEYDPITNTLIDPNPTHPADNYATTEPIVAIPHANGIDHWVVVKPIHNLPNFGLQNPGPLNSVNGLIASYLVTQNGIQATPVMSSSDPFVVPVPDVSISPIFIPGGNTWIGNISVSPNKKYIAFSEQGNLGGRIHLYYFNAGNGHVEFITTIRDGWGFEFSPNSEFLYTSFGLNIRQYDLSELDFCNTVPPNISFSFFLGEPLVTQSPMPLGPGDLQLGPDDKIYIARTGRTSGQNVEHDIAIINFPNEKLTSSTSNECGFNYCGVSFDASQRVISDLPNDIIGFIGANETDFLYCSNNCGRVCFTNLGSGVNFSWDFGDGNILQGTNGQIPPGTNNGLTTGNFEYPCHAYANPGTYTVSYSIDGGQTVTHDVDISLPAAPVITGPTSICQGNTLPSSYYGPPGFNYNWISTTGQSGSNQSFDITWTNLPQQLALIITDPLTECSNSTTITIEEYECPDSIDINIKVFLEGAMETSSQMSTALYERELLPGMSFTQNQVGTPTAVGQPYNMPPWDYNGTEGDTYTTNSSYANTVVDWIIVSFRTDPDESTQVAISAALLMKDGTVQIVGDIELPNSPGPYYIVVQHRNHLPIMSTEAYVNNGILNFDFTTQNSLYTVPSFGQNQIVPGVWAMYAGNCEQTVGVPTKLQLDINGADKAAWQVLNGNFQIYLSTDMDLNGDTNGADKIIWSNNNGIFSDLSMTN